MPKSRNSPKPKTSRARKMLRRKRGLKIVLTRALKAWLSGSIDREQYDQIKATAYSQFSLPVKASMKVSNGAVENPA